MEAFIEKDGDGNKLEFDGERFYLSLSKKQLGQRMIGLSKLSKNGTLWYIKDGLIEKDHMFGTKSDNYPLSWGLHEALIKKLPENAMIGLKTDNGKYSISVKDAVKNKFDRKFKNQGFELQLFVPLDCWKKH